MDALRPMDPVGRKKKKRFPGNVGQNLNTKMSVKRRSPQQTYKYPKKTQLMVIDKPNYLKSNNRSLGPVSQQAMRIGGWANPSSGGELKFIDQVNNTSTTAGSAAFGAAILLNGCVPGSTASDRIGRRIHMKSLLMRWEFAAAGTTTWGGKVRILIVYDKQANAATATITDILLSDHVSSQNNLSNRDRFVTICDYLTPNEIGGGSATPGSDMGVIYKKLNLETMFNAGNAGTIGDITSGSLLMFVATDARVTTAGLTQATRIRVRYTDV